MTVDEAESGINFPVSAYEFTFIVTACEPDLSFTSLDDMTFTWEGSAATQTVSVSDANNCGYTISYTTGSTWPSSSLATLSGSEISVSTTDSSLMCQTNDNNELVATSNGEQYGSTDANN